MASEIIKFPRLLSRDGQVDYDTVLVLARTDLFLAVAGRGHVQDTEVILYHLPSLLRAGERESLPGRRGFLSILHVNIHLSLFSYLTAVPCSNLNCDLCLLCLSPPQPSAGGGGQGQSQLEHKLGNPILKAQQPYLAPGVEITTDLLNRAGNKFIEHLLYWLWSRWPQGCFVCSCGCGTQPASFSAQHGALLQSRTGSRMALLLSCGLWDYGMVTLRAMRSFGMGAQCCSPALPLGIH